MQIFNIYHHKENISLMQKKTQPMKEKDNQYTTSCKNNIVEQCAT
jgi:hypothetical protein